VEVEHVGLAHETFTGTLKLFLLSWFDTDGPCNLGALFFFFLAVLGFELRALCLLGV
jgi:hypothetical protein